MNIVDVLLILLIIASAVRGVDVGFARQFGSLAGLWLGIFVGGWVISFTSLHDTAAIVTIIACIVFGVIAGEIAGAKIKQQVHENRFNHIDRALGAGMGIITILVVVWLGSTLITVVTAQSIQVAIRDSAIIRFLDRTLPPATDAISSLETYFRSTGLPEIVKTEEPTLPESNVALPNISTFSAVLEEAKAATVEVEGRGCAGIDVGSGFVTDDKYIITNAHVVAGMRTPFVKSDSGRRPATVVAFDPLLDIAILSTEYSATHSLSRNTTLANRDSPALVLGFPGGGDLVAHPALVADTFLAIGKDIYGDQKVSRKIYALNADIQKGNSGGPLIDTSGRVIGIIFARSTAYNQVGYALLMADVEKVLEKARTEPSIGQSLRCL